jgi:hypothetical protein
MYDGCELCTAIARAIVPLPFEPWSQKFWNTVEDGSPFSIRARMGQDEGSLEIQTGRGDFALQILALNRM